MPLAGVVLDLDGTILDTESIDRRLWPQAAADCGYALDDSFYLNMVGRSARDNETALLQHFGEDFPMAKFRDRGEALWQEYVSVYGIGLKPGFTELLKFLEEKQFPIAVATSSRRENVDNKLRIAGLEGRFKHVVTGDEIQNGKPAPDIYLEAARRLGVRPGSCAAIEDSDPGALSAAAAGMTVLFIPDLRPPSPEAYGVVFRVLSTLAEVPAVISSLMAGGN